MFGQASLDGASTCVRAAAAAAAVGAGGVRGSVQRPGRVLSRAGPPGSGHQGAAGGHS